MGSILPDLVSKDLKKTAWPHRTRVSCVHHDGVKLNLWSLCTVDFLETISMSRSLLGEIYEGSLNAVPGYFTLMQRKLAKSLKICIVVEKVEP